MDSDTICDGPVVLGARKENLVNHRLSLKASVKKLTFFDAKEVPWPCLILAGISNPPLGEVPYWGEQ